MQWTAANEGRAQLFAKDFTQPKMTVFVLERRLQAAQITRYRVPALPQLIPRAASPLAINEGEFATNTMSPIDIWECAW